MDWASPVVDGFYAKEQAWDQVAELGLFMITKLRSDANMNYIYQGKQKSRGRKRRNGGKVDWKSDEVVSRFDEALPKKAGMSIPR